jgi:hypothetical protein
MTMRRFLALSLLLLAPLAASAQFIGYVGGQTTQQKVFTNQAANGSSITLTNLGQAAHFLTFCDTAFGGTISLVASPDGTFSQPITLATASFGATNAFDTGCHILQAGGYFPTLRVVVSNFRTGSVSAWYSAISMPIGFEPPALNSSGPASPIACDLHTTGGLGPGVNGIIVGTPPLAATSRIYICQMTISFNGATSAGEVTLSESTDAGCLTNVGVSLWQIYVTANTPQVLTFGGPVGSFFSADAGRCVMINLSAIGASVVWSVSYATF